MAAASTRGLPAAACDRFFFLRQYRIQMQAEFLHRVTGRLENSQIDQIVAELRPLKKLGRKIGHGTRAVTGKKEHAERVWQC